jgi:hypothetical protein
MSTMPNPMPNGAPGQEPGWVSRLFQKQSHSTEYMELKFALHRKLLDRVNLEILSSRFGPPSACCWRRKRLR